MFKHLISLLLAMALVLTMTAALGEGISVTDMYGREVALDAPAARVVALTAADCEILCALGAGDVLVGRGAYCDYPADILSVPVVQSGAETNIEEILALAPQVVLMGDMAQSKDVVDLLERSGVCVAVSNADDVAGVYEAIAMIGAIVGKDAEAQTLISDMRSAFDSLAAEDSGKTVYFEVSPLMYGLWTAGSGTFMDELAGFCGLTNTFSDVDGWAAISEEQVLLRDPDVIVTISMYDGEGPTPEEEIMARPGWGALKAVESGCVYRADADEVSRPGPRLKDAAVKLYEFVCQTQE